jgi:hypothetical protein
VLNVSKHLEKKGYEVTYLSVNAEGEIDLAEFKNSLRPDTALVAVMWANNETGVIFPVEKMAEITKEKNDEPIYAPEYATQIPLDTPVINTDKKSWWQKFKELTKNNEKIIIKGTITTAILISISLLGYAIYKYGGNYMAVLRKSSIPKISINVEGNNLLKNKVTYIEVEVDGFTTVHDRTDENSVKELQEIFNTFHNTPINFYYGSNVKQLDVNTVIKAINSYDKEL